MVCILYIISLIYNILTSSVIYFILFSFFILKCFDFWYAVCLWVGTILTRGHADGSKKQNAMKALIKLTALVLLTMTGFGLKAQDYRTERLNLPGDNLNLYAAMDLFQKSETLEGFERSLNDPERKINNLDLNGDNYVDYIRVIDYPKGNDHTIVLQVAINERENQDVAVITVFKDKRGEIFVQMIGDEDLYGKDYIIEPIYAETPNPGYTGSTRVVNRTTYVEVYSWPVVRYIYAPSYTVWYSPWHWGYYPTYWSAWSPYYWDYYYGYHSHWHNHYYAHYRHCNTYRYHGYQDWYYRGHRHHSNTVHNYRDNGRYNHTYSRPDTRSEGSAEYVRRYGNSGSGRDANGTAIGNTGRTKQSENTNLTGRTATPVVGNRSASPTGRTSASQATGRSDNKKVAPAPVVNNRSAEPTGRNSSGQNPARFETKREASTPVVGNRTTQTPGRTSTGQGVGRSETKRESPAPSVNSRTSEPTGRNSKGQNPGRFETKREAPAPSVNTRSSQTGGRNSGSQNVGRSESPRQASAPSVSRSSAPKSSGSQGVGRSESPRQASAPSVKSGGSSSPRSESRAPAQSPKSNAGGRSSKTGR